MSFHNDNERERRRRPDEVDGAEAVGGSRRSAPRKAPGEVGDALRTVYQRTIAEDIPPEMLDLLGKLG